MDDDIRPKALLIPFDKFVVLDMLNPVQYKRTITSMRRYVEFGEEPSDLEQLEQMAFETIRPFMDSNISTYQRKIQAQRENGRKRGKGSQTTASHGLPDKANESHGLPSETMGAKKQSSKAKANSKATSTTSVVESEDAKASNARARSPCFEPPDLEEVKLYFADKSGTEAQAERFFYHYEANGWKVGKNSMKNWKAAASGWLSRDKNQRSVKSAGTTSETIDDQISRVLNNMDKKRGFET